MAMETVFGLAIATGRTLVMPPALRMYLIGKFDEDQKAHFGFADFFPFEEMAAENEGLNIISMEQYLLAEAMTGNLRNTATGQVEFPPDNRTDWNACSYVEYGRLRQYLRNVTHISPWKPGSCVAAFPSSGRHEDAVALEKAKDEIFTDGNIRNMKFPIPVNSSVKERLFEIANYRSELCLYDEHLQKEHTLHFMSHNPSGLRYLVHFYAFLFFEDWKEDLWMKRFIRDHGKCICILSFIRRL
jgi:GDP-fucose protein O-fucosyltransferase